ncbi:hypothetical protein FHW12_001424 [Dokdonella fugitiva]|uniref:Uncharacterized protein n=1 Tax=Dokdonella fugitiva TaxID=328517 RepID=A0A839F290_9GAMM|nr:hypothetical protein [Dokdonella fugitiva]MBA8887210.1 hypothetical protein [Dokdonella fugitiva]
MDERKKKAGARGRWIGALVDGLYENAGGIVVGRYLRIAAALPLGIAVVMLAVAWHTGPQAHLDAARYASYTARAQGTLVESWIALDFDPDDVGDSDFWQRPARALPCMVVAYAGDWGAPIQRAFCGDRFQFSERYVNEGLDELMPGVPFFWRRDARGFAVPEIRLSDRARGWLAATAIDAAAYDMPPLNRPRTAYAALRYHLDRPLEHAIAGWSAPAPTLPLALDPARPADVVPAGYAEAMARQADGNLPLALIAGAFGLGLWWYGMGWLMGGLPRAPLLFATVLPLLLLPWWGRHMPLAIAHVDSRMSRIVSDMLEDVDHVRRLRASAPADAVLANGTRVQWTLDDSEYKATLGWLRFAPPAVAPANADAALAALAEAVTVQMRTIGDDNRVTLFDRLAGMSQAGRYDVGLAFAPAAREAMLDPHAPRAVADAAHAFLREWLLPPVAVRREDGAYDERRRLHRTLADLPDAEIAAAARTIGGAEH